MVRERILEVKLRWNWTKNLVFTNLFLLFSNDELCNVPNETNLIPKKVFLSLL